MSPTSPTVRPSPLLFVIYNTLLILALPLIPFFILIKWRGRVTRGLARWDERWGKLSVAQQLALRARPVWWWVHAVSLGEIKAIEPFLRAARSPSHGLLLSVITPEAIAYAEQQQLADVLIAAPIDLPWVVRRVFATVRPKLFISVESEFWPNLLRAAKRYGARVALINGRLSARSFRSYSRIRFLVQGLWNCFDLFAVREAQDAERLERLGVPGSQIQITGNLKYDLLPLPSPPVAQKNELVLVFGSTREKEEALLLPVVQNICKRFPGLRVIWAPRHLERVEEIESLFSKNSLDYDRKSLSPNGGATHLLWDTMGDLMTAYRQADIVVIGGSFVQKGGQNPIEPATLALPVVFGPSMENFHAISVALLESGGARQVPLDRLEQTLSQLLSDSTLRKSIGARARQSVEQQQGATERTLRLLEILVRE